MRPASELLTYRYQHHLPTRSNWIFKSSGKILKYTHKILFKSVQQFKSCKLTIQGTEKSI